MLHKVIIIVDGFAIYISDMFLCVFVAIVIINHFQG